MSDLEQLDDDLWTWSAPRQGLPDVMRSYLLTGDTTTLVDPLATEALDDLVGDRVRILVTTPFHVRGSEALRARWVDRDVTIHGHKRVAGKLADATGFEPVAPAEVLPDGATVVPLGKPPRPEQPWHLPGHSALAFGDSVVEVDGELRIWPRLRPDALAKGTYEDKFLPTLRPMAELDVDRVLLTHGSPVLRGGAAELARALERPIWKRAELY
jgi:glyoxylase-like metal-dependent hydrolase (beta-lactamase superfamily II)